MDQVDPALQPSDRVWRLRIYRLLANSFAPLFTIALLAVALRWTYPQFLSVLVVVWTVVAFLLVVLVVPWLVVSLAFRAGLIKCPSCGASFSPHFALWVSKTCQSCGFNIHTLVPPATSNNRWRVP